MRNLLIAFTLTMAAAAHAAPDAKVLPSATSKYGFVWKKNKEKIGTGAEESDRNSSHHFIYRPVKGETAVKDKLLVFLHGGGSKPSGYTDFLELASQEGYFVIALSFPMKGGPNNCAHHKSVDLPDCGTRIREEVWSGEDTSTISDVSTHAQDSIHNRLHAVLHYLAANPKVAGKGWDKFVDGEKSLAWGKIVLAGHSLGSGYAAFIAKKKKVSRVIMLAGTSDGCDTTRCMANGVEDPEVKLLEHELVPTTWIDSDHATDADDYYGLVHTGDVGTQIPRQFTIRLNWELLGLPCCETTIDGLSAKEIAALSPAPHRLLSSMTLWKSPRTSVDDRERKAHNGVAHDGDFYKAAWRYMLTAP